MTRSTLPGRQANPPPTGTSDFVDVAIDVDEVFA
jgi:hypothetical protein